MMFSCKAGNIGYVQPSGNSKDKVDYHIETYTRCGNYSGPTLILTRDEVEEIYREMKKFDGKKDMVWS